MLRRTGSLWFSLVLLGFAGFSSSLFGQANLAERYLLAAANQERASYGLSPLAWDRALADAAVVHARLMAVNRDISHRFPGEPELSARGSVAGARFSLIAENVAEAPSVSEIHSAWMASEGHRENLLDPNLNAVGVAVVVRDRQLYAVEDFARVTPALSLGQQEYAVQRLFQRFGIGLLLDSPDARAACLIDSGFRGSRKPGFIMRYTAGALDRLPSELTVRLASRRYHQAAVGACEDSKSGAFSGYRVAVLLYP